MRGHPLKGPCQATKTTPLHDFDLFSCTHAAVSYHHLCQCRSFFRFRQSCFAAPVTHQDQDGHRCSDGAPSAVCGPENLRFQAVSKWWSQVSWLLTSPKVAHGVGSTDGDNSIILRGGAARQSGFMVFQPNPMLGRRSSHVLTEELFRHKRYVIAHDVIGGSGQFVGQCPMGHHDVGFLELAVVIGSGLGIEAPAPVQTPRQRPRPSTCCRFSCCRRFWSCRYWTTIHPPNSSSGNSWFSTSGFPITPSGMTTITACRRLG